MQPGVDGPSRTGEERLRWVTVNKIPNPERVESIPNIPFIKFNFVMPQQLPELILKRSLAMTLLLSGEMISHRFDL